MISILLVDAIPSFAFVDYAAEILPKVHAEVGQHYKAITFGQGMAKYAEAVDKIIAEYDGKCVYVSSRTPEGSDAVSTLIGNSSMVVRGVL